VPDRARRVLALSGLLCALAGCPTDPEAVPEPEPEVSRTQVDGVVLDHDSGEPRAWCEVGVDRADSFLSDPDGRFSLTAAPGEVLHVLCSDSPLYSFEIPEVDALHWDIRIDQAWGPDPATSCSPTLHLDGSALPESNGGWMDVGALTADTAYFIDTDFYLESTWTGVFPVPAGDYQLFARAWGGESGGFVASDRQSCAGDGSVPEVEMALAPIGLRELHGTWSGVAAGAELAVHAHQAVGASLFDSHRFAIAHSSVGGPEGWSVLVADAIGTGPIDIEACQTVGGSTACVNRLEVDEGGLVPVEELPTPVDATVSFVDDERLTVSVPVELTSGRMVVRLHDWSDPLSPLWRATSWSSSIDAPLEWLDGLPSPLYLSVRVTAQDGVTFDLPAGYEPLELPDGWIGWSPDRVELGDM